MTFYRSTSTRWEILKENECRCLEKWGEAEDVCSYSRNKQFRAGAEQICAWNRDYLMEKAGWWGKALQNLNVKWRNNGLKMKDHTLEWNTRKTFHMVCLRIFFFVSLFLCFCSHNSITGILCLCVSLIYYIYRVQQLSGNSLCWS